MTNITAAMVKELRETTKQLAPECLIAKKH